MTSNKFHDVDNRWAKYHLFTLCCSRLQASTILKPQESKNTSDKYSFPPCPQARCAAFIEV